MQFADLRLSEPLLRAISEEKYTIATPIQAQAIPHVLEGRDLLGCAQTGTGKTAAFALPILQRLSQAKRDANDPTRARALILCPTRELATQISDSFRTYGKHVRLHYTVIFGGVPQGSQVQSLRHGVDVIIATPGRLLDLINQNACDLRGIEMLVLDEADRMLDMGFIHDVKRIVAKIPKERQTLFFSATMPNEIRRLADSLLKDPATVQIAPESATADRVEQSVYFVDKANKPNLLAHLYESLPLTRAIVFTRTKHGADRVVQKLESAGIRAEAIHGNKSQNARQRALKNFRSGRTPLLVATDIAARGIDIDDVSHVVNYDLTHEPETYVHRIGRTARAGAAGMALSFCDREEVDNLRAIQKLIKLNIPVETDHPNHAANVAASAAGTTRAPARPASNNGSRPGAAKPQHRAHAPHPHPARPRRPEHGQAGQRRRDDSPRPQGRHDNRSPAQPHGKPQPRPQNQPNPAPQGKQKRTQPGRGAVRPRQVGHPLFA